MCLTPSRTLGGLSAPSQSAIIEHIAATVLAMMGAGKPCDVVTPRSYSPLWLSGCRMEAAAQRPLAIGCPWHPGPHLPIVTSKITQAPPIKALAGPTRHRWAAII